MHLSQQGLRLNELSEAPEKSGVYAWYYEISLSNHDIDNCLQTLEACESRDDKISHVRAFLENKLFRYFEESPYEVRITGPMKPTYHGHAKNILPISQDLVLRLVDKPSRIRELRSLLSRAVPFFASPIYIGVAKNLRVRLQKHQRLIDKFSRDGNFDMYTPEPDESEEENIADHSFAREVSQHRNFRTSCLMAFTMEFEADEKIYFDLENILNRINYPLCGRN